MSCCVEEREEQEEQEEKEEQQEQEEDEEEKGEKGRVAGKRRNRPASAKNEGNTKPMSW